jgi:hypothetical protein
VSGKSGASALLGTWRLAAFHAEDRNGRKRLPFGRPAKGRLMILPDGYMMVLLTAKRRRRADTDAARAQAFKSIFAYSGRYRYDGKRFITDVDLASIAEWMGKQQIRTLHCVGDNLRFTSKWAPSPFQRGRVTRGIIEFEREKQRRKHRN